MTEPTFDQLLDAADAYEAEKARWLIRTNKMAMDFPIEVCRRDDDGEPVVVIGTRHPATADNERAEQSMAAAMRAALPFLR
jgi:hypothetical protein